MDPVLKQRLVGAAVLVSLAIIFIPPFLDQGTDRRLPGPESIPPVEPPADFSSRVVPLQEDEVEALIDAAAATPPELPDAAFEQMPEPPVSEPTAESATQLPAPPERAEAVEPASAPRTGVTAWVVQLGSFSSEENAVRLTERLRREGFAVFIEKYRSGDSESFRVRVGPALTREEAEALQARIVQAVETEGIVVRYP